MSNDHAYELRELMTNWLKSMETMGEQVRESLASFTPPVAEPGPVGFEHTDRDGDWGRIAPGPDPSELYVNMKSLYLDQDAVNRLAQYLDRHRTDQADTDSAPCWTNPIKGECPACGHYAHGSVQCSAEEPGRSLLKCPCRGGSDGA